MLKKLIVSLAVMLSLAILCGRVAAQETSSKDEKATEDKARSNGRPPLEQYHLDFSVNELEDGRKINSRQYSMNLDTDEGNEIKIGSRVPVETKEGEFQYLDVGTNIFARIGETRGQQQLVVRAELSNFAPGEPNSDKRDLHPPIRQIKMGGSVLLPLTKTFVMGSADDPNSKRQFQLEVTVIKVK